MAYLKKSSWPAVEHRADPAHWNPGLDLISDSKCLVYLLDAIYVYRKLRYITNEMQTREPELYT